jgi:four helix bundle protein
MARDPKKLRVFAFADALVPEIYLITKKLPPDERYGLTSQMRRAAVSIASNIVEGCARRSEREYLNFLNISNGSAYELSYLVSLCVRLGLLARSDASPLTERCEQIAAALTALINAYDLAET